MMIMIKNSDIISYVFSGSGWPDLDFSVLYYRRHLRTSLDTADTRTALHCIGIGWISLCAIPLPL